MLDEVTSINRQMLEDMKISQVSSLVGMLTLGQMWTTPEERLLWAACLEFLKSRGDVKRTPTATLEYSPSEGNA